MATRVRNRHLLPKIYGSSSKPSFVNALYPTVPLSKQDTYVTTVTGDRLDLLAHQFYGDVRLWWVITAANPDVIRRDSYALKPGIEIRIPGNHNLVVRTFERINTRKDQL